MNMKNKRLPAILTGIFILSMIILTICSKSIYSAMLPQVELGRVTKEGFQVEYSSGDVYMENAWSIPKEAYHNRGVYVVVQEDRYGMTRNIVGFLPIEIGRETDTHYEIIDFSGRTIAIILSSNREIHVGDEVHVNKTKAIKNEK